MSDNITLADMHVRDVDNLQHVLKQRSKLYYFFTMKDVGGFMNKVLYGTLEKFGIDVVKLNMNEHNIDQALQQNNVKVENRPYEGDDRWRSGLYIYKDGEIVEFIGHPKKSEILGPRGERYSLLSTYGHSIKIAK